MEDFGCLGNFLHQIKARTLFAAFAFTFLVLFATLGFDLASWRQFPKFCFFEFFLVFFLSHDYQRE